MLTWTEPPLFVWGLFAVTACGALLWIRIDERQDHIILTIAATVDVALLGPRALVLVWGGVAVAAPAMLVWCMVPRNRERLGGPGALRSVGWSVLSAFSITVGFVVGNFVYSTLLGRSYPIPLATTSDVLVGGLAVTVAWVGTMTVRVVSLRSMVGPVILNSLDPLDSVLLPYLMPLMGGFPLIVASVALYRPDDPWSSLLILWWCFPIYLATWVDLHRRRIAQDLRRDASARQRLAAIGEVSARIVHQSRHQVGLMGWSIHRLRPLIGRSDPEAVALARAELDALAESKDRLSDMLASELLHEDVTGGNGRFGTGDAESAPDDEASATPAGRWGRGGGNGSGGPRLGAVLTRVEEQLRPEAEGAGIALERALDPALAERPVPVGLQDVLFNLVDNAIDAAVAHVVVEGAAAPEGGVVLRVVDDGAGLVTEIERAFEPFFTTKSDGTGMGLAIADALVGDLGGELRYERGDGRTVFVVTLPAAG